MPSERVQRQIDQLLDQAEAGAASRNWEVVIEVVEGVLALDPDNPDAAAFKAMAERAGRASSTAPADNDLLRESRSTTPAEPSTPPIVIDLDGSPTSFANDRYQVSKFLGEGGKKRVYQAHDTLLDRDVAFALIKTEGFDQTSKERISREAQAMGRLGVHPNIVAVLDLGQEDDGTPYMVTELMGGGDVEALLAGASDDNPVGADSDPPEGGPLPAPTRAGGLSLTRTIEIGKSVCEGLEFAHGRGIVHRDLKPGNVWLTEEGAAKIGDFGLAIMTDRSRLTREGMMVGTVSYMPPEQAIGGEITLKADLYSLGAMLYEMVTGRPPFLGDDEIAIIGQHINTPPVAPTWHNKTCPRPLEALVMRLLSKDPAERPDSAKDVFNALNAIDLTVRGETVELDPNSLDSLAGGVFVGRQAEMDQLKAALEDVLGGNGRLVTLVGEPGIGKTRTSEELATYAALRGAQVLWGRCYEGGGAPPYWPWVQAIRSYVREINPDDLRRQMGSSASVIADIVPDIRDALPELQQAPVVADPDSARFRLFDSIMSFLKSASQARPIVIILDDLQWADRPSLAFLEFMARELNQSRVLMMCTYRDMELNRRHPLSVTLGDLARERLYERVLLRGLSEQDVGRFIEIAAGIDPPLELSATVHRHTEGNPLFVTEVVRELVQSGDLVEASDRGVSTWSLQIPEGVREVIGRRLDRMSEQANEMLTTAAVVGRRFTLDGLVSIVEDSSESQLLDVLDEALAARVIEELPSSTGAYQFTHALIQETLVVELSAARKVRLHARIAEALETLYCDVADDHASELVPHFAEAEPVLGADRLIRYSAIAGRRDLDAYAYEAAVEHLGTAARALEELPMSPDSAAILSQLGMAQIAIEDQAAAATNLTRAFDYYADNGMTREAIEIAARPHNIVMIGRMASVIQKGIALAADDSHERGRLLVPFGWLTFFVDQADVSSRSLIKALEIARSQKDPVLEMQALAMQANIAGFDLRSEDALRAASSALELARTHHDPESEMRARLWYLHALTAVGRVEEGLGAAHEFFEAALKLGHRVWINRAANPLAAILIWKGDWRSVLDVSESVIRFVPADAALISATVGLWTGDYGRVRSEWDNMLTWAPHVVNKQGVTVLTSFTDIFGLLIDAIDDIGSSDEGVESVRRSLQASSSEMRLPVNEVAVWRYLRMRSKLFSGDAREVEALYEPLADLQRGVGFSPASMSPLVLGKAALSLGKPEAALAHVEDAIRISRRDELQAALARSLADSGAILRERNDEGDVTNAEEREDEALNIARELGMRPLTERILARREILRA